MTISSNFDAGNMRKCEQVDGDIGDTCHEPITATVPKRYEIWISCDGLPYRTSGMRTWFYFYVDSAPNGQKLTFVIKNMNRQAQLYNKGLRPVYRTIPSEKGWARVPGSTSWCKGQYGLEVKFDHVFHTKPGQKVYFAFTYPYSYHDIQEKLTKIEKKIENPDFEHIYYHRELLGRSIENRNVELITLTSKQGITTEHEDLIED